MNAKTKTPLATALYKMRKEKLYKMSNTRKYRVVVNWTHHKWGPHMEKLAGEGSSIRRALNNALLGFFSDASRRQDRRDAHVHLRVEAWRLPKG